MVNDVLKNQGKSNAKQSNQSVLIFSYLFSVFLGFALSYLSWEIFMDAFLYNMAYINGISTSWFLFAFCLVFGAISAYLFYKSKGKGENSKIIPVAIFLAVFAVSIFGIFAFNNYKIRHFQLSDPQEDQYFRSYGESEGYHYIGTVIGYEKGNQSNEQYFTLYVKNIEGKLFYYCSQSFPKTDGMMLVSSYGDSLGIIPKNDFIINFDFNWDNHQ